VLAFQDLPHLQILPRNRWPTGRRQSQVGWAKRSTVLAIEDVRWADEASGARRAQVWHKAGYRHEYAMALAESADTDDQLAVLGVLDALGAKPAHSQRRSSGDFGSAGG
jgi:hypothetical protein